MTAPTTTTEANDQMISDMLDDTARSIYYWAETARQGKGIVIYDEHHDTHHPITREAYQDAAKKWAATITADNSKFFRNNAAQILAGFWQDVDYDAIILDQIAQVACHGRQLYS